MAEEKKGEGGQVSLNIKIGKEIDASLGDVIRGLLVKPAEATGDLLSDTIGILGDAVNRKRTLNAKLGLEEVRRKLEDHNVDMKDITPPKAEELHLLINGLSLSDDANLRELWAGLFAKALEPNSNITAERPFLSVLQSLSPMDAKIIDFLAYVVRRDSKYRQSAPTFRFADPKNITPEEKEELSRVQEEKVKLLEIAVRDIEDKAREYSLDSLSDPSWAENLMRLGVIERAPLEQPGSGNLNVRSVNRREISEVVEHLAKQIGHIEQSAKRSSSAPGRLFSKGVPWSVQLEVHFTKFGKRFAEACGLL